MDSEGMRFWFWTCRKLCAEGGDAPHFESLNAACREVPQRGAGRWAKQTKGISS